ncbi:tripartite tricarboxylate transporter substrate binding protein [Achromobacter aloeverae]|uniref:Tripartite tricarboxylate transporter substrate binding protein n=1 Tax=Achromobacter aloeverae TaxID=1750518 RepID=A0A4Q1HIT1_9BURK|nr:tripartite tricarboxylate transporter substrate binding protein [Achromobacter aloeverae]RXN88118.1 tripartite tricarboxylate transporter substrate binding protein [Achromobacter aloeverae]
MKTRMGKYLQVAFAALVGAAALTAGGAARAAYPEKAVRIIVPYTPGGFNDTMARLFAKKLQEAYKQPFIVENKPGAGTIVGTEQGARAAPDGYTLTIVGFPLVANQFLYKKLPYDAKDFAPIIVGAQTPNFLVVKTSSPVKSLADFVKQAKERPGRLNYATAGTGTSNHLTMVYFEEQAKVSLVQVPYKGSAPMVTDLLGGQVDVMFDNSPNVLPHLNAGKMRALAVTSEKRSALAPNVPTVAEQGYPDFSVAVWYGLAAPAGTPPAIVSSLNEVLNQALQSPDVKKVFADQGVEPVGGSVQDFQAFFDGQIKKWGGVIRNAGIQAE